LFDARRPVRVASGSLYRCIVGVCALYIVAGLLLTRSRLASEPRALRQRSSLLLPRAAVWCPARRLVHL